MDGLSAASVIQREWMIADLVGWPTGGGAEEARGRVT